MKSIKKSFSKERPQKNYMSKNDKINFSKYNNLTLKGSTPAKKSINNRNNTKASNSENKSFSNSKTDFLNLKNYEENLSTLCKTQEIKHNRKLPELLSPAGSLRSLYAAVYAGADAVYFGMPQFNARINADNISDDNLDEAIKFCHLMGAKAYITLNTQIYDKEKKDFLNAVKRVAEAKADAIIVGDLGSAALIKRHYPSLQIHASTQLSGHNANAGAELQKLGFSRMVCAREMSIEDIKDFTKNSPIEAEIFVHGALCVCHSGQCLFSSLVGGRSGNRGLCAQPCRLPYTVQSHNFTKSLLIQSDQNELSKLNQKKYEDKFPLSLKDLCLANHINDIIDANIASLKIEGRMKPYDYVYRVTKIYRNLLDDGRDANQDEIRVLSNIFSRNGFTDGYFEKKISKEMLGTRTEKDKELSKQFDSDIPKRKVSIYLKAKFKVGLNIELLAGLCQNEKHRYPGLKTFEVSVKGNSIPEKAKNMPLTEEVIKKNITKLGNTVFTADQVDIDLDKNLMVPLSIINQLRRDCIEKLQNLILSSYETCIHETEDLPKYANLKEGNLPVCDNSNKKRESIGIFKELTQINESSLGFFDKIYLPCTEFAKYIESSKADELKKIKGVILPPVIFDSEKDKVESMLLMAKKLGATDALVGNIGHIYLAKKFGFTLQGDFRLNASNIETTNVLESFGFKNIILSPELTLPKIRDISKSDNSIGKMAIVYGKIPLMVLEKCLIYHGFENKQLNICPIKDNNQYTICRGFLIDRTMAKFPVMREFNHRNIVYNSIPTYMGDKQTELKTINLSGEVFLFSNEDAKDIDIIIRNYNKKLPLPYNVRRIGVNL